jgi:hypothetical protein
MDGRAPATVKVHLKSPSGRGSLGGMRSIRRSVRNAALLVSLVLAAAASGATGQSQTEAAPTPVAAQAPLPVTKVVLFTSGVGYFQRDGEVEGNAELNLYFRVADINDLLKSMVLRDFSGGQITGVNYASRDPLTRGLRSFAIDLSGDPGLAGILAQVRGEAVEVQAWKTVKGTVVGLEAKPGESGERVFLNLLTAGGLTAVPLEEVQQIRLLNPRLQQELRQALALLADSHSTDRKRVTLRFSGQGRRQVQVGYLLEAPLWKTSYRLVLGDGTSHFLQGWAIVENATEEDWREVRLSLVSGRPISFIMDLYQPVYVPRPRVEPELYASLAPQRYEEDLSAAEAAAPRAKSLAEAPAPSRAAAPPAALSAGGAYGEQQFDLRQGVASAAQAAELGSFFQYLIQQPVSIPRQESAMLPIVAQEIEGRRFSIYNEGVLAKHPLLGLKLVNHTGLDLMGGPITVYEAGSYAGDAQIDTLPAGAERLISFAVDLGTEVAASGRSFPETLVSVRILRGSLISTRTQRKERLYTLKNSGSQARDVLIEHPLDANWKLVQPEQPEEQTRDSYRFLVPLAAGSTAELSVVEERQVSQTVQLTNLSEDQIAIYLRAPEVSGKAKQALQGLTERKAALAAVVAQRQALEQRVSSIYQEQTRIRSNMERLERSSDLYSRYVGLLNAQEDQLAVSLAQIDDLRQQELKQREALDAYILSLDVSP